MVIQEVALIPQPEEGTHLQANTAGEEGLFLILLMLTSQLLGDEIPLVQPEVQETHSMQGDATSKAGTPLTESDTPLLTQVEEVSENKEKPEVAKAADGKKEGDVQLNDVKLELTHTEKGEELRGRETKEVGRAPLQLEGEVGETKELKAPELQKLENGKSSEPVKTPPALKHPEGQTADNEKEHAKRVKTPPALKHPEEQPRVKSVRTQREKIVLEETKGSLHQREHEEVGEVEDSTKIAHPSNHRVSGIEGKRDSNTSRVELIRRIANAIVTSARASQQSVRLRLEPPHLGNLRLHIVLTRGEELSCTMQVENTSAQQLLEGELGRLRTLLEEAGFTLQHLEVALEDGSGGERYSHDNSNRNYSSWHHEHGGGGQRGEVMLEKTALDLRA